MLGGSVGRTTKPWPRSGDAAEWKVTAWDGSGAPVPRPRNIMAGQRAHSGSQSELSFVLQLLLCKIRQWFYLCSLDLTVGGLPNLHTKKLPKIGFTFFFKLLANAE